MLTELFNEAFGMIAITFLAFGAATSDDRKQLKLTNVGLIFLAAHVSRQLDICRFDDCAVYRSQRYSLHFAHVQWLKTAFMLMFVGLLCFLLLILMLSSGSMCCQPWVVW